MVLPLPPDEARNWTGLSSAALPLAAAAAWAVTPACGALVVFAGTVRDHAEGRRGVSLLEYEAYEEQVVPRLDAVAGEARDRWPSLGRLVLLHRVGPLHLTETSVLVVASAAHRGQAFDAARWCIDTMKATLPIWKREHWADGADWGTGAATVSEASS